MSAVLDSAGEALMDLDFLKPDHFVTKDARLVFETALGISQGGGKPSRVVVAESLRDQGVPSPRDIVDAFALVSDSHEDAGRIIAGKWLARQIIDLGHEVAERGISEHPEALLDEIERRTIDLRPSGVGKGFQRVGTLRAGNLDSSGEPVSTGYGTFDAYLGGLVSGRLITIASRPGVGKTTLALNFAANAVRAGRKAAFYSLEMSSDELVERLIVNQARVGSNMIKGKMLTQHDIIQLAMASMDMDEWSLFIDDSAALTVFEIGARAKKLARAEGLDLLIIDYMQLIDPPEADSRVQELAEITRYLKRLSRELRVPIVALSQLSRGAESHEGAPRMSDLRESGAIENDSDQILALWRHHEDYEDDRVARVRVNVIKNRHGPIGDFPLDFVKAQARFE